MKDKPNWKKGDIVVLLDHDGGVLSLFKALIDPVYYSSYTSYTILRDSPGWYYGLRNCEQIRPATIDDIDHKIKIQKEKVEREQLALDKLLNFRERITNVF